MSLEGTCFPFQASLLFLFNLGIVAFRQHLQNLARTKGILELNKVQLLYEQMRSENEPAFTSTSPHLQDLGSGSQQVSHARGIFAMSFADFKSCKLLSVLELLQ